jgi:hypothetical protein
VVSSKTGTSTATTTKLNANWDDREGSQNSANAPSSNGAENPVVEADDDEVDGDDRECESDRPRPPVRTVQPEQVPCLKTLTMKNSSTSSTTHWTTVEIPVE